jgi:hypothetical protein
VAVSVGFLKSFVFWRDACVWPSEAHEHEEGVSRGRWGSGNVTTEGDGDIASLRNQ